MMSHSIEPLRFTKETPLSSPRKRGSASNTPGGPLSELSPSNQRRNSPSYNQFIKALQLDSSPFETSPFGTKFNVADFTSKQSPLAAWRNRDRDNSPSRDEENADSYSHSPSGPTVSKRSSIEKLKQASRVKNSNIFAMEQKFEYDPASKPLVERPLASGPNRALGLQARNSLLGKKPAAAGETAGATPSSSPPETAAAAGAVATTPATALGLGALSHFSPRDQVLGPKKTGTSTPGSPSKSALAQRSRFDDSPRTFDPANGTWSDDEDNDTSVIISHTPGEHTLRNAKSVTFDANPQVNEYEMTTPDPSSVASGSREGSYNYDDEDEEDLYPEAEEQYDEDSRESSFNENPEEEKTAVVVPEDWRYMSVERADTSLTDAFDDVFAIADAEPQPKVEVKTTTVVETTTTLQRTDSVNRPLPPLPAALQQKQSEVSLHDIAERLSASPARKSPSPTRFLSSPKADVLSSPSSSMTLTDRLNLLNMRDSEREQAIKSQNEELRERRLRRAAHESSPEIEALDKFETHSTHTSPKKISRDSILKNLKNQYEYNPEESITAAMIHGWDPDVPLPSLEESMVAEKHRGFDGVEIKQEDAEEVFFSPALEPTTPLTAVANGEDDDLSEYSRETGTPQQVQLGHTPLPQSARDTPIVEPEKGARAVSPLERTPESVIHRSISPVSSIESLGEPVIPQQDELPKTTIKAGRGMKTRASLAPQDIMAMAETRRKVSNSAGVPPADLVPPIPDRSVKRTSAIPEERPSTSTSQTEEDKRISSLVKLDLGDHVVEQGLSLDREFERVMEAQKKGYLMRENSKVVVASASTDGKTSIEESRDVLPDPHSPHGKTNNPSSATWTKEPWNGKIRRKSIRRSGIMPSAATLDSVAPPLPGMSSNVNALDSVTEADVENSFFAEDGVEMERGRLFIKVVGVKDLNLPLPRGERSYFAMTLDNGIHCVTTSWLELGRSAAIGQEFELIVMQDLEFQLTLKTKIEQPPPPPVEEVSRSPTKQSAFSRLLQSPKKKREVEEAQRASQRAAEQRSQNRGNQQLLNTVGPEGNFARSYVSLSEHEQLCYGRPLLVEIPCFNEWAVEEATSSVAANMGMGSMKSARGNPVSTTMQRKPPYRIGTLDVQLLFVPMPKNAKEDDMPKSMNACIRDMNEAENASAAKFEGHLSQQGGDCPYWRRRFFRLEGSKLTAYHEATRQPRATINLAKASKLIDDKSSLTQKEVTGRGGSRRRSAFGTEEEGYMFVEEGFRIRFANGEVIDFYADSTAEKDQWMLVLADAVGKDSAKNQSWTGMVLKRERSLKVKKVEVAPPKVVPKSPVKVAAPVGLRPQSVVIPERKTSLEFETEKALPIAPQEPSTRSRPAYQSHQRTQSSSPVKKPSTGSSREKAMMNLERERKMITSEARRAKAKSIFF